MHRSAREEMPAGSSNCDPAPCRPGPDPVHPSPASKAESVVAAIPDPGAALAVLEECLDMDLKNEQAAQECQRLKKNNL